MRLKLWLGPVAIVTALAVHYCGSSSAASCDAVLDHALEVDPELAVFFQGEARDLAIDHCEDHVPAAQRRCVLAATTPAQLDACGY